MEAKKAEKVSEMQTIEYRIFKNIECLGDKYYATYLSRWDKEKLLANWWEALRFFFSHSFMRGRRDVLSNEYYYFTVQALQEHFSVSEKTLKQSYGKLTAQSEFLDKKDILNFKINKGIGRGNAVSHKDFENDIAARNPIVKLLITKRDTLIEWNGRTNSKRVHLGNGEDVMMVLDVLKLISNTKNRNIYKYLYDLMTSSGARICYRELIEIRAIADKIAALIIRDMALMNPELKKFDNEACEKAFPVDTWVTTIADKLGCSSSNVSAIKSELINKCEDGGIDPLKFAAGLWFLGFHSLDILLDMFRTVDIDNNSINI